MAFTGNEDQSISLAEAAQMTAAYRNSVEPDAIKGCYFSKDALSSVLQQTDCVGVRMYFAKQGDGSMDLVVVGVKANEDDLIDGIILERSFRCPPICGVSNDLNS